jgi:uncharacterized membrane protein
MKWYQYLLAFLSGMLLANAIPHFVNGISGNPFPTPFANPPGKGLSVPFINVLWGVFNMVMGYLLLKWSKVNSENKTLVLTFFLGVLSISIMLSIAFLDREKIFNP